MQSTIVKRSVVVAGQKTSVSLEDAFWKGLKGIARESDRNLTDLVSSINSSRQQGNLSSAIRLFVLNHYQSELSDDIRERPAMGEVIAARATS